MAVDKVKVLEKSMKIFSYFFTYNELTFKELTEYSGFNRTTLFRILQSFIDWEYIKQDPVTKKYSATLKILEMAGFVLRKMNIIEISNPYLVSLRDSTEESIYLGVLNNFKVIVIESEQSSHEAHVSTIVGRSFPAYCSGTGKVLLAHLPEKQLESLLKMNELKPYTKYTITDIEILQKQLEKIRKIGYGVSIEEFREQIVAISAPIFDMRNQNIAAISCAALKSRITTKESIEKIGLLLKKTASDISSKLGSKMH